ncbi:MAG: helix-turn-helix transcriptional regulator [Dehalococcoidia bacterium]|nr:helix-turn-helix transcriptional regulator [Dehalococcoidia bacterium]
MTTTFEELVTVLEHEPATAERIADLAPSRELALMLARLRMDLGLTQAEFARRAGVSQAYISQLESGIANPSIQKLGRLLRSAGFVFEFSARPANAVDARRAPKPATAPDQPPLAQPGG